MTRLRLNITGGDAQLEGFQYEQQRYVNHQYQVILKYFVWIYQILTIYRAVRVISHSLECIYCSIFLPRTLDGVHSSEIHQELAIQEPGDPINPYS